MKIELVVKNNILFVLVSHPNFEYSTREAQEKLMDILSGNFKSIERFFEDVKIVIQNRVTFTDLDKEDSQ